MADTLVPLNVSNPFAHAVANRDEGVDVSVAYAEALMDGQKSLLVIGRGQEPVRYVFGLECKING